MKNYEHPETMSGSFALHNQNNMFIRDYSQFEENLDALPTQVDECVDMPKQINYTQVI